MANYRFSFFWNQSVMGVSETYWTRDTNASGAAGLLQQLLSLRSQMMWQNQPTVGVRVAIEGQKRTAALLVPPKDLFPGTNQLVAIPGTGVQPIAGRGTDPDLLRTVLQLRLNYDDGRSTLRYLSGIPDISTGTEPTTFDNGKLASWFKSYTTWWNFLVDSGWMIKCLDKSPQNPAFSPIGLVKQPLGNMFTGVALPAVPAPNIIRGDKVLLRGFRPAKGVRTATMNGTWYVDSVDSTTVAGEVIIYLRGSQLVDPALQRFTDMSTVQKAVKTLRAIQAVTWVRAGIHKRGRPSIAPRGRRLTHVSLDP